MFIAMLFTIAKLWKQLKCPSTDRWIKKKKKAGVHVYNAILINHKKEENFIICSNMGGPKKYYAKWNESEEDKYHMISLICWI